MELTRIIEDGISIVNLTGNLLGEKDTKPILESVGISLENDSNRFVFNLEGLKFINSTGLSVLITTMTKSRNAGGDLVLVNLPDQLVNLLAITKLTDVFTTSETVSEAKTLLNIK